MGAKRWAGITLVVLIIGVAVVAVSMERGVWERAVYSDWRPHMNYQPSTMVSRSKSGLITGWSSRRVWPYCKVKRQRWPWLPGQDVILIEIPKDEYEELEKEKNSRAKGGQ